MRRGIKLLVSLLLACYLVTGLYAQQDTDAARLDAVLVMDASGSMQDSDPSKLGQEGMKLFIDMLSSSGNQAGIVTYGAKVDKSYPMTDIKDNNDREQIKQFIDSMDRKLENTDITSGLGEAISMLDQRNTSSKASPVIIVFTDGNNAIGGVANRTDKDIEKDLKDQIDRAQKGGYPVYTIGLNGNGKLNEDYLKQISKSTGGLAFATNDPKELPDILTQIFCAHSRLKVQSLGQMQGTGDFESVKINIPNQNVLEANIAVTSNKDVDFKLQDPSGTDIAIPSSGVTLSRSSAYHLLKVAKPVAGDWTLAVKGVSGDQININLVYNYDLDVIVNGVKDSYQKGDLLELDAALGLEGKVLDDESLYKNSQATLVLTNTDTKNEMRIALSLQDKKFVGSYTLKEEGNYTASVFVEDTSYTRQSSDITFKVGKAASSNQSVKAPAVKKTNPVVYVGGVTGLFVVLMVLLGILKVKKSQRPLVGQVAISVREIATGKVTPTQYKKLSIFKGKVSLHALLSFAPEFKGVEGVVLKRGNKDEMLLLNSSAYTIEKNGRSVKMQDGLQLKKNEKVTVNMGDCGYIIQIEYLL